MVANGNLLYFTVISVLLWQNAKSLAGNHRGDQSTDNNLFANYRSRSNTAAASLRRLPPSRNLQPDVNVNGNSNNGPRPIPLHYFNQLLATDPYYAAAVTNGNYYYPPTALDNGPYPYPPPPLPPAYDLDYYPNLYYYLPAAIASSAYQRRLPYNSATVDEKISNLGWQLIPLDDDDDEDVDDDDYERRRADKEADEDLEDDERRDFANNAATPIGTMSRKPSIEAANRRMYDRRYEGIDGFGRPKQREKVFGSRRPLTTTANNEDRVKVYGVPVSRILKYNNGGNSEDEDVKELKSLRNNQQQQLRRQSSSARTYYQSKQQPELSKPIASNSKQQKAIETAATTTDSYLGPELNGWINGDVKRGQSIRSPVSATIKPLIDVTVQPTFKSFPRRQYVNEEDSVDYEEKADENSRLYYSNKPDDSVFDTIKKLLAMEDRLNMQQDEKVSSGDIYADGDIQDVTNDGTGIRNYKRSISTTETKSQNASESSDSKNNESVLSELQALRTKSTN